MLRRTRIEQIYREEAKGVMDKIVESAFAISVPDQENPNSEFRIKQKFRDGFQQIDKNYPDFYKELTKKIKLVFDDEIKYSVLHNEHTTPKPSFIGTPGTNVVEGYFFNSVLHNAFLLLYNDMNSTTIGSENDDMNNTTSWFGNDKKPYTERVPFKFGKKDKKPFEFKFHASYNINDININYINIKKERQQKKADKEAAENAAMEAAEKKKRADNKDKRIKKAIHDERQRREEQMEQQEIAEEIEKVLANEFPKLKQTGGRRTRSSCRKKRRSTKRGQSGGGLGDIATAADEFTEHVIIPGVMKIPELLLRLIIPLARGQMKKIISEKLEERPLQARVFILTSIEITVHTIIKENADWYKIFDQNFEKTLTNYAKQMGGLVINQKLKQREEKEKKIKKNDEQVGGTLLDSINKFDKNINQTVDNITNTVDNVEKQVGTTVENVKKGVAKVEDVNNKLKDSLGIDPLDIAKKSAKSAIKSIGNTKITMGRLPGKYPPDSYKPCCTPFFLDPNYLKMILITLKKLSVSFPDLIGEFNLLPKVLEKYFTTEIFDTLLQQCLCEKIKKMLMSDPQFMTFMEVAFKTYPLGVQFKKQYINEDLFLNNFQKLFDLQEKRKVTVDQEQGTVDQAQVPVAVPIEQVAEAAAVPVPETPEAAAVAVPIEQAAVPETPEAAEAAAVPVPVPETSEAVPEPETSEAEAVPVAENPVQVDQSTVEQVPVEPVAVAENPVQVDESKSESKSESKNESTDNIDRKLQTTSANVETVSKNVDSMPNNPLL